MNTLSHYTEQFNNFCQLAGHLHRGGAHAYYWGKQRKVSHWFKAGTVPDVPSSWAFCDSYFGVHPVNDTAQRKENTRATLAAVAAINCLFAEFDLDDFDGSLDAIETHIDQVRPAPSVTVFSGGGIHAYWLLTDPRLIGDDADREAIRDIQKRWQIHVGGDKGVNDLARILRIPGTLNFKYTPPRAVLFRTFDMTQLYRLDDLVTLLPGSASTPTNNTTTQGGGGGGCLDDQKLLEKARGNPTTGANFRRLFDAGDMSGHGGDHSVADLALCRLLAWWTDGDAGTVDRLFRQSALMRDKWERADYREDTIEAAIDYLRQHHGNGYQARQSDPDAVRVAQAAVGSTPTTQAAAAISDPSTGSGTAPAGSASGVGGLPKIVVSGDLREMRDKALAALVAANQSDPTLFVSNGALVEVATNGAGLKIRDVTRPALLNRLIDQIDWLDGKHNPAPPSKDAADLILALRDLQFPVLTGIAYAPMFGRDGRLYTQPGYVQDIETIITHDLVIADVEATPEAVATARNLWCDELLADFPFVDDASKAHAVALGLLPFVRHMIAGATPMHLIEAALRGSGKGLLVAAVSLPALGRAPESRTLSADENEVRKAVFTALLEGRSHIVFDNASRLDSDALALALTQDSFEDRILGTNTTRTARVRCVWAATGNNLILSEDIGRRCVFVRLEPKTETPELRAGFRHRDLLTWAEDHRATLVWAALVLIQNWIDQGRPTGGAVKGSFQQWTDVIGGILATAGIPGFLGNERASMDAKAPERDAWRFFIAAWWSTYSDKPITVGDLCQFALPDALNPGIAGLLPKWGGVLEDFLNTRDLGAAKKSLAHSLSAWDGRVLALPDSTTQVAVRRGAKTKAGTFWRLEVVDAVTR